MKYDKIKKKIEELENKKKSKKNNKGPVNLLEIIKLKREGKELPEDYVPIKLPEELSKKILQKRKELEDWEETNNNG